MNSRRLWLILSALAVLLFVGELAYSYRRLPPQVALHFDGLGRPKGWGSKQELLGWTIGGLAIMIAALSPAIWITAFLPASLINLPNRDYWLAPERAVATRRGIIDRMGWFFFATLLLLLGVFRIALRANLQNPPQAVIPYGYFVLYGLFVVAWLGELLWHFYHPPPAAAASGNSADSAEGDS
jgi:serine/threonine-protein kinase